jgi:hypothetical protein
VTRGLLSAILLAIMIASIVGNTLVIVVISRNKGMRTRTNLLLFNLALTDLLASVLDMPVSLVTAIRAEWIFPSWMCMFNGFTTPLFIVASIHTLMYMSIHKFVTVRNPHSHALTKRRILVMNGAAWCWGIIASALTISGLTSVSFLSLYMAQFLNYFVLALISHVVCGLFKQEKLAALKLRAIRVNATRPCYMLAWLCAVSHGEYLLPATYHLHTVINTIFAIIPKVFSFLKLTHDMRARCEWNKKHN